MNKTIALLWGKYYRPVMCVLAVVFVACGWVLISYLQDASGAKQVTAALGAELHEIGSSETPVALEEYQAVFTAMQDQNPDIAAWITVEGTGIDYPVAQGEDNEFYLNHSADNRRNGHGSIFMDFRNQGFDDYNTIIYGHNMYDGTMFGPMVKLGESLARDRRHVITVTEAGVREWEIFSGRTVSVVSDIGYYDVAYSAGQMQALSGLALKDGRALNWEDRILTLSTCKERGNSDDRYVLQARLIQPE